jgi:hypothetical protein
VAACVWEGEVFLIKGGSAAAWKMEKKVIGFLGFFLFRWWTLLIFSAPLASKFFSSPLTLSL